MAEREREGEGAREREREREGWGRRVWRSFRFGRGDQTAQREREREKERLMGTRREQREEGEADDEEIDRE